MLGALRFVTDYLQDFNFLLQMTLLMTQEQWRLIEPHITD
jgi:hypothetical protein